MLAMSMAISSAKATTWVEVARWSEEAFPEPKEFTTGNLVCNHVEWRIRWIYTAVGSYPYESLLLIEIYEQGNPESIGLIYKSGYISRSGIKNIHNNSGTFYLDITLVNIEECTIIVEQDVDSIPEFTPATLIIGLIMVSTLAVALSKKISKPKTPESE